MVDWASSFFWLFLITQSMLMKHTHTHTHTHTSNLLCFVYVDQVNACLFLEQVQWTCFFFSFLTTQNMMPTWSLCFLFCFWSIGSWAGIYFLIWIDHKYHYSIREASFETGCVITNFLGFNREFSNKRDIYIISI